MNTKNRTRTILTLSALLILVLGLGYLGLRHHALRIERDRLLADRTTLEERAVILKKSYSEQKAQAENSLRARQAAEAKAAKANQLLAGQEGELKVLKDKVETLEVQVEKQRGSDKGQQAEIREAIAQWKAKVEELQGKNAMCQTTMNEQKARSAELEAVAASTKAALENETRQHQGCREKNATLAGITRELAKRYQKKGVAEVLAANEPFTQLEKVEAEKLVQEYLDRIDTATLPRTGAVQK